jgi:hypothetical protein
VIGDFVRERQVGLLARHDDPADVAEKLIELLEPERNRAMRAAAAKAAPELRWDREAPVLTATYVDAVAASAGRQAR